MSARRAFRPVLNDRLESRDVPSTLPFLSPGGPLFNGEAGGAKFTLSGPHNQPAIVATVHVATGLFANRPLFDAVAGGVKITRN
jgi:hypothetical protein